MYNRYCVIIIFVFTHAAQGDGLRITVSTKDNSCKISNTNESWPNTSIVPLGLNIVAAEDEREGGGKIGKLTGTVIHGKSNLVMRERRWKKPVRSLPVVKQTKTDLTAYALTKVLHLQELGEISFTRATDDNNTLRAIVSVDFTLPCEFEKGWARRVGVGQGMYGEKYTRQFRVDIEEQYQLGEISSNAKSSPAKILEYLQKKVSRGIVSTIRK